MENKTSRTKVFHIVSALTMLFLGLYAYTHLILFVNIPSFYKVILLLVFIALSQCMTGMRYIVSFTPHMSYLALHITGALSAFFMTLVSLLMLYDIGLIILFSTVYFLDLDYTKFLPFLSSDILTSIFFILSLVLSYLGCRHALNLPKIRERKLYVKNLPAELEGLRIAHLSDLHVGSTFDGKWLSTLVKNTNELDVDLVLITGDLVDGSPDKIANDVEAVKDFKAKYGTYISLGNHEFYCGAYPWVEKWRSWGVEVLVNQNVRLSHNDYPFVLSGVADKEGRKFKGMLRPDMGLALKDVSKDDFIIHMEHQPKNAHKNAERGVNVQLSGHTHGGQYFLLFPLIKIMNGGFRVGFYYLDGMTLYVSPGTGIWGYAPVRVGSTGELTVLNLSSKK